VVRRLQLQTTRGFADGHGWFSGAWIWSVHRTLPDQYYLEWNAGIYRHDQRPEQHRESDSVGSSSP